jgi:UTP--glucose-1-phosphate uridylyltransferase
VNCTKAIIPVSGYGTRRLPVTKTIEKCMLPLLNRPIVDYIVEDCVRAGIEDIYFVISDGSQQLRHYYSRDIRLEDYLRRNGKERYIDSVTPPNIRFHFIEQDMQDPRYGTTVPVWLCRDYIDEGEHVLVVMGDQCLYRRDGGSEAADLMGAMAENGADCGMVGVPVPDEEVEKYGIIETDSQGNFVQIVEKPKREDAPSNLNNASLYLFNDKMLEYIDQDMRRPHDGEYMITDPINAFVKDGGTVKVTKARGKYLDCGTVEGWVEANNYLLQLKQGLAKESVLLKR